MSWKEMIRLWENPHATLDAIEAEYMKLRTERDRAYLDGYDAGFARAKAETETEIDKLREALAWMENLDPVLAEAAKEKFALATGSGESLKEL